MRPRKTVTIGAGEVHGYAGGWLDEGLALKDHGPKCTASRIISILLKAASRICSIFAACRDLADAPCDQAVRNALDAMLPEPTWLTALRRTRHLAIDRLLRNCAVP